MKKIKSTYGANPSEVKEVYGKLSKRIDQMEQTFKALRGKRR